MTHKHDALASVITCILGFARKDASNIYSLVADQPLIIATRELLQQGRAEDFHYLLQAPFEQVADGMLESLFPGKRDAQFLVTNYRFVERHFNALIDKYEGVACCSDKSRTICHRLLMFFTDGTPISFDYTAKYTFHLPTKIFTTQEEIVEFYYGLRDLHYGSGDRYIKALASLMQKVAPQTSVEMSVRDQPSELPQITTRQEWCCSEGCGACKTTQIDQEYYREETLSGELVESKSEKIWVSDCCKKPLMLWDKDKNDFIDFDKGLTA